MNKEGMNYSAPIFFDLETSGLSFEQHEVTQIGAVCPTTGDRFECKVKFDIKKASPEALDTFGYSKKRWKKAISKKKACEDFCKFLKDHTSIKKASKKGGRFPIACLAGYNVSEFDKQFLIKLFKDHDTFAPFDYRFYDVLHLAYWVLPGLQSYKLTSLVEALDLKERKAHDAIEDVEMTIDLAAALLDEIGGDQYDWWSGRKIF